MCTTKEQIHNYWQNPSSENMPSEYLKGTERSQYLVNLFKRFAKLDNSILEIGCNSGRNLAALFAAGYHNLNGIEINSEAVRLLKETYPQLSNIPIYNSPVEDIITNFGEYDIIFTLALLEHIHPESEWIFEHIAYITRHHLLTIEDEKDRNSWRKFPREYKPIFIKYGFKHYNLGHLPDKKNYIIRLFRRLNWR